jgi:hypothetical protein
MDPIKTREMNLLAGDMYQFTSTILRICARTPVYSDPCAGIAIAEVVPEDPYPCRPGRTRRVPERVGMHFLSPHCHWTYPDLMERLEFPI